MFSEAGHRVVCAATAVIAAGVDGLAGVVHLFVIPQVVLPPERPVADITQKGLCLTMNQNMPF